MITVLPTLPVLAVLEPERIWRTVLVWGLCAFLGFQVGRAEVRGWRFAVLCGVSFTCSSGLCYLVALGW